jgi:hypothetical protein
MNILIISHSYFPALTPRAIRWSNLHEEFLLQGHNVQVVSSKLGSLQASNNKDVFYVGSSLRSYFKTDRIDTHSNTKTKKNFCFKGLFHLKRIISLLSIQIHSIFLRPFRWPDFAWPFIFFGFISSRNLLKKKKYDLVITVSHPFSSHLIGIMIKYLHPQVRWIADNGDPFSFMDKPRVNNFFLYKALNKYVESKVLHLCDGFAVTTEGTSELYRTYFHSSSDKIKVIGPLLSKEATIVFNEHSAISKSEGRVVFNFFGTLYSTIRNPRYLIEVLDLLSFKINEQIEVNFYGEPNDISIQDIRSQNISINFHGMLSRNDALNKICTSDILLNIGNSNQYQLPSKLVEYVASANPIINFAPIANDSSSKFLSNFSNTLTIFQTKDSIEDNMQLIYNFLQEMKSREYLAPRVIDEFSPSCLATKYLNF